MVSLVEYKEQFVMEKLAKRLDVQIPELKVAHGRFQFAGQPEADNEAKDQDWEAVD